MLTTNGKAVAVAAVLLLVGGALLNYPELVAIGLAGAFVLIIATAWIVVRLDLVAVRTINPVRVTEGEPSIARLTITNRSPRRSPPVAAIEAVGNEEVLIALPSLAREHSHTAEYDLPTSRRGVYRVGPLSIGQSDPLRLFSVGRKFTSQSVLHVHPLVHPVAPVPTGNNLDMEGPTSSGAPQGGIAFHAIREFRPGDDYRLIHWRSSAKTNELRVRQLVVPDEPQVVVVLDASAAPYTDESFEDAVRVAASLAISASEHNYPVELRITGGGVVAAEKTGDGRARLLDLLAAARRSADDPGLTEVVQIVPDAVGMALVVVTGQVAPRQLAVLGAIRHRFQMVSFVQVGDQHDRPALPPSGVVGVNVRTSRDFVAAWNRLVRRR